MNEHGIQQNGGALSLCEIVKQTKTILLLFTAGAVLVGCGTPVMLKSDPDGASVYRKGAQVGTTPYATPPVSFGGWSGELRKPGYVSKPVLLQSGGPAEVKINLEKDIPKIEVSSEPAGAKVSTESGVEIGVTPITIAITNETQVYEITKDLYHAKTVTLSPSSARTLTVTLDRLPGTERFEIESANGTPRVRSISVYADRDVIERSPSVRAVRRLTDFPTSRQVNGGALSPDGKRFLMDVFDSETAPDKTTTRLSNLWSIDVGAGGRLLRCTDGAYLDASPCFSPDGRFAYFASTRAGKNSIFRMSANSVSGLGLVTTGTTIDRFPKIAPDGNTLLWTAMTEGTTVPQLWSLALTNGLPTGLPMQLREGQEPTWSPDGKTVVFTLLDRNLGKYKIWTMLADGSQPTQLTTGSDCNDTQPSFSPDGTKLIFASDRGVSNGKQNFDIWIMSADGSNPKQLTTNGSHDDHPVISADGKTVYFKSNRGLKWDVWVMEMVD